jgi:hypothetical protein
MSSKVINHLIVTLIKNRGFYLLKLVDFPTQIWVVAASSSRTAPTKHIATSKQRCIWDRLRVMSALQRHFDRRSATLGAKAGDKTRIRRSGECGQ